MQPDDTASKRSSQTAAGGDDVPKAADAAEPAVTTQYPPAADAEKGAPAAELSPYGAHVFADGGRKAWLTVAGAWLMMFSTFGLVSSFGVFEDFYVRTYHKKASDVAWLGSLQLCLMFTMGLVVGKAFDEGHFHLLMTVGTAVYIFGLFMLSLANPAHYYQIFLSQGVTCGLGLGLVFLPTLSVLSHHFLRRRALAVGIAFTGSSAGGVVFTLMLNNLFRPSSLGFANGVRVAACVAAAPMLAANALMRTDVPPRRKRAVQVPLPNPAHFFRDRDYVLGLIGLCCLSFAVYFPVFYIQIDAAVHGIEPNLAFYTLTILNAFSIPGRLLPNFAADRLGILNVTILSALACGAITLGMLGIRQHSVGAVVAIAAVYGFFSGALLSLVGAVVPTLSRSVHEIGMRTGIVFLFMGLCGLLGSPIAGWLLGPDPATYAWWRAIVFSAVLLFVSAGFVALARRDVARRRASRFV